MRHKVLYGKMFLLNWSVVMNDKQQQRSVNHSTRRCKEKKKGNLHICFSSTLATKNPFALVSRGEKKISQHVLTVEHSTSIISCYVCVNVSAPVSNRARGRGRAEAPVLKLWNCAYDPIMLSAQREEGSLLFFPHVNVSSLKHYSCLRGSLLSTCQVTLTYRGYFSDLGVAKQAASTTMTYSNSYN